MTAERRGIAARLGIVALNLLMPGLGLLRTGDGRMAGVLLAIPWAAVGLLVIHYVTGPQLTFVAYTAWTLILLLAFFGSLGLSAWLSWRRSAERRCALQWWSRWYGAAAIWVALLLGAQALTASMHRYYKPFYIPAEGMMPTMQRNDRIVASMRPPAALRRGDIVLVRSSLADAVYVKRLAALPGDRIAMRDGIVMLNDEAVPQRQVRLEHIALAGQPGEVRRLAERFPGERREHEIYDIGPTAMDDFAETVVRPGHVFLLGDNRDMSADSRVPRAHHGLEQVPLADVVGRPLFFSWWPGSNNSGRSIAY